MSPTRCADQTKITTRQGNLTGGWRMGAQSLRAHMHAFSLFKNQLWLRSARDVDSMGSTREVPAPLWGRENLPTYAPHKPGGLLRSWAAAQTNWSTAQGGRRTRKAPRQRRRRWIFGPPTRHARASASLTGATPCVMRYSIFQSKPRPTAFPPASRPGARARSALQLLN